MTSQMELPVDLPTDPEDLLRRRRFRDPVFLRLFLAHLDDLLFRDPHPGLKFALMAPPLARLIAEAASGPAALRVQKEQLVKAHAILAGAYRVSGRLEAAESEYEVALQIADSTAISAAGRVELNHRLAILRASQNRFADAYALVDEAAETLRAEGKRERLAEARAKRGLARESSSQSH